MEAPQDTRETREVVTRAETGGGYHQGVGRTPRDTQGTREVLTRDGTGGVNQGSREVDSRVGGT